MYIVRYTVYIVQVLPQHNVGIRTLGHRTLWIVDILCVRRMSNATRPQYKGVSGVFVIGNGGAEIACFCCCVRCV